MKKILIFSILLCFTYSWAFPQTEQEQLKELIDTLQKIYQKNPYQRLSLIRELYTKMKKDSLSDNLKNILFYEQLDHNLMFRNYDSMQVYYKKLATIEYRYKPKDSEIANFKIEAISFKKWLSAEAKNKQAVFFNEAHQSSQHRYLVYQNLQNLYDLGFRYLAIEWMYDSLANQQPYPLYEKNIPYINEIVAGELRREAKRIGYTIISYDHNQKPDSSFVDYNLKVPNLPAQRDWNQAINLQKQVFEKDKSAKLVLLGGYDHIQKHDDNNAFKAMAYYFKHITNINPLTIDQSFGDIWDNKVYKKIYNNYVSKDFENKAVVFRQKRNSKIWIVKKGYDASVFHPSYYTNSDPSFLYFEGTRKKIKIKTKGVKQYQELMAVQAFAVNEGEEALPLDQIEIDLRKKNKYYLFLGKGEYRIRFVNSQGKFVHEYLKTVK